MPTAVAGRVRFDLAEAGASTLRTLGHMAVGPISEGAGDRYAAGWADMLATRLRARLKEA